MGPPSCRSPPGPRSRPERRTAIGGQVTVEGWIFQPSTSRTKRDGFDLVVTSNSGENLRREPNGAIVGRVREGTLLERVGEKGKWFRVRRDGWVPAAGRAGQDGHAGARSRRIRRGAPGPRASPDVARLAVPAAPAPASSIEGVETVRQTGLSRMADSAAIATLPAGTPARVVGRSGEWVRVQVEGWLREADVKPAEAGVLAGISAAEVRASPERFVGQTLDWRLQVIAVQLADELRPEMPSGQPYLLTRGPLPEPGFVYVTIPARRIAEFRALPPLQEMVMRVTLKAARTRYLATPVADLVSTLGEAEGGQ